MTTADTRACVACGAEFAKSRTDSTRRCPACRHNHTPTDRRCVVCGGSRTITVRTATRGDVTMPCYRCAA